MSIRDNKINCCVDMTKVKSTLQIYEPRNPLQNVYIKSYSSRQKGKKFFIYLNSVVGKGQIAIYQCKYGKAKGPRRIWNTCRRSIPLGTAAKGLEKALCQFYKKKGRNIH